VGLSVPEAVLSGDAPRERVEVSDALTVAAWVAEWLMLREWLMDTVALAGCEAEAVSLGEREGVAVPETVAVADGETARHRAWGPQKALDLRVK
jgi:hypothetical protein